MTAATIRVNDILISTVVRRELITSGPTEIDFDMNSRSYRLTGPNIVERLHHAVRCAGERPIRPDEITELHDGPMTATEVLERQRAFVAEQEQTFLRRVANRALTRLGRDRAVDPPLLTYPGAINRMPARGLMPHNFAQDGDIEKVERKAKAALWTCLDDQQREQLFVSNLFSVSGSRGKYIYRIGKGTQGNVHRDDGSQFCLTHKNLPVWDLMLAQKLMIQDDEPKFLKMANRLDEPALLGVVYIDEGPIEASI